METPVDVATARAALTSLEAVLKRVSRCYHFASGLREFDAQLALESMIPEETGAVLALLRLLDSFLTGKVECRNQDVSAVERLLRDLEPFHVHLSDGGYSRLTLTIPIPNSESGVRFDYGLSRPPVKVRWESITKGE